jgi:hypothetical protein
MRITERTLKFPVVQHYAQEIAMSPRVHPSSVVLSGVVTSTAVTALTPTALTRAKAGAAR